jgi:hypothetical protein
MAAAAGKRIEDRLSRLESAVESLVQKLGKFEEALGSSGLNLLTAKVDELASKQAIVELAIDDKIRVASEESDSKIVSSEIKCEEKLKEISDKCVEAGDKALAIEVRLNELSVAWPSPQEGWTLVTNPRNKERKESRVAKPKISFAEKFKDQPRDTIVLVGDSLTRGVGAKMEYQSSMVSTTCRPGAHVADITWEVGKLADNDNRHLVLLVGTNDIKGDGSEVIVAKYKDLLKESKKIKNRRVTIVGIPRRVDLSNFQNSRRIGVNLRLKKMCKEMNVDFLDYEPGDSRIARDGIHLNHLGQDELGYKIFQHCRRFLV